MNCPECEQLFDAYLDGQLAGTLRLEFDAHRLRCPRCQQTLAMHEAIGNVIATDRSGPTLAPDFTERVMQAVEPARSQPRVIRFPTSRTAMLAAAVVQAVALITFVVVWQAAPPAPATAHEDDTVTAIADLNGESDYRLLLAGVEDQVRDAQAAGSRLTSDMLNLVRYLDIQVPESLARESLSAAGVNPWQRFWDLLGPGPADDESFDADGDVDGEIHSI